MNFFSDPTQNTPGKILIKSNYRLINLEIDKIVFIKALADYVIIKTTTEKYITLSTMKDMCDSLPKEKFARTHRSFIINMNRITQITGMVAYVTDETTKPFPVPIGRVFKKKFKESLKS